MRAALLALALVVLAGCGGADSPPYLGVIRASKPSGHWQGGFRTTVQMRDDLSGMEWVTLYELVGEPGDSILVYHDTSRGQWRFYGWPRVGKR